MKVNACALFGAIALALTASARAQPSCDDPAVVTNPVYIQAEDTQVPTLKALGKRLRAQASPITIVYSSNGSCSNVAYMYQNRFTPNANAGGTSISTTTVLGGYHQWEHSDAQRRWATSG